jgi:cytochrome bd-type quinol oxidase subunit 2
MQSGQSRARLQFARHLVEMFVAMMAGMMVGAFLLATAIGTSVSDARREHAIAWVVVMAFDMTVPMVAVMLYRGHSLRSAGEMAAAMIVPALPIVALQLSHAVSGEVGRAYMPVSMVAMVALIVYRRREYRTNAASASRSGAAAVYPWRERRFGS